MQDFISGRRDLIKGDFAHLLDGIKAVAFDLDGTLIDSIGIIIDCTRYAFRQWNLECPDDAAIMATIGLRLEEGLRQLLPDERKSEYLEFTELYRSAYKQNPRFLIDTTYEDIEPLFVELKKRGIKVGYASGRSRVGIENTLKNTFLGNYCDGICAGSEVPSKPDPEMMRVLCERMQVLPEEVLGIGDAGLDIDMFKSAGCRSLGVQTGVWSGEALLSLSPDYLIPKVSMIPKLLAA